MSVLDRDLKNKSNLLREQEGEKTKLDKKKNEQTVVLGQLTKQERQFSQDIQKKRQQQNVIDRQIKAEIARQIKIAQEKAEAEERERARVAAAKAKAEGKAAPVVEAPKPKTNSQALRNSPEDAKLSDAFEGNRGSLPWPVATGTITSRFGTYRVGTAIDNHEGVIYQTSENASVRAIFGGKVSAVFEKFGKWYVMIKHGEYFTIYQNLKNVSVSSGQTVTTKQSIGTAGLTDGIPEVGLQINRGATPLNPESWVAR
ncbi:MAG: hypothetical protein EOO87_23720 [Pedobacter sp.]|nr:MAG: hypothetical protein EOO87_23720 [Pedobacter sp.]